MKYFLSGSFVTIIILIVLFGYRQNIFSSTSLPYDDEQQGLDDQITIHFSHVVAENTPKGMAAEKFAQLVEEKSNGRVIVKIYPNGMLYNDETELEALQANEIQMIAPTFSKLTASLPNWQVLDLPFIIDNNEQLKTVLNGSLSDKLLQELDNIEIKGLTFWNNGFKQVASTSPILNVEDFNEKRVRMMPSNILKQQFKLLGADPIPTSFGNVYYDLQNKHIDAQENTISNIYSKRFYTMENHITLSNHGILCYAVMMNESFWNSLDENTQTIIIESLKEIQDWQFDQAQLMNEKDLNDLKQMNNVKIYELQESDRNQWKKKIKPIYEIYENQVNKQYLHELLQELNKEHIIKK
ncbi:C4-dicarboxylate-binding protein DctP [Ureibacillus xyleni]|uniref:C4-dicarboxylate-binding protein DctP n=1 Tax=Ureibacillus xyleni TaxID=614648 RepID=A0A285TFB9_9BACL|nr:DctP family TRAP transporter solute-binding subunit [Ureibacillus xyleni]SOC20925.1 C4-dicarboxylate-binding protein DctP [Ureibacillus xyleni]